MKTFAVLGVLGLILLAVTCGSYNGTVNADQGVKQGIGDLDAAYQRRADLIPNLVKTVQAAGTFEKSTFTEIAATRANAGQLHINAADLSDPAKVKAFESAQAALSSSLGRLLAVAENYPTLKATEGYRDLMSQLEGTENRIQTERHKVNEKIREYNVLVLGFPSGMIARSFGFQARESFQAAAGSEKAPVVEFGASR